MANFGIGIRPALNRTQLGITPEIPDSFDAWCVAMGVHGCDVSLTTQLADALQSIQEETRYIPLYTVEVTWEANLFQRVEFAAGGGDTPFAALQRAVELAEDGHMSAVTWGY